MTINGCPIIRLMKFSSFFLSFKYETNQRNQEESFFQIYFQSLKNHRAVLEIKQNNKNERSGLYVIFLYVDDEKGI